VTNPHGGLSLIAEAESIQGIVPPHVRQPEGPFGDHYGYYSLQHDYPILQASHLYHRKDAVFPATVVGKPPQEDMFLGTYIQELMAPLSKRVMPAIKAMWSYGETGYHSLSTIVVEERYPREAMKFAFRILGEDGGQLNLTKFLVVIDRPMDLGDFRQVLAYALARAQLQTDLFIIANLAMDTLDYTGPEINKGSKGSLIGVGEPVRDLPHEFRGDLPYGANAAAVYCAGALAVQDPTYDDDPDYAQHLAGHRAVTDWPLIFLVDDADVAHKNISFLWSTFTRFEPAADTYATDTELRRHHPCYTPPVVLDCRMKPGYPDELIIDESTAKKVTNRWSEYFPAGNVERRRKPDGLQGFFLIRLAATSRAVAGGAALHRDHSPRNRPALKNTRRSHPLPLANTWGKKGYEFPKPHQPVHATMSKHSSPEIAVCSHCSEGSPLTRSVRRTPKTRTLAWTTP